MKSRILRYLTALSLSLLVAQAHATIISIQLEDVMIGDTLYDVILYQNDDGGLTTFNSVYGTSESPFFTFTSEEDATMAAQALYDYALAEAINLSPFYPGINGAIVPFSVNSDYILGYMLAYVSIGQLTGPFGGEDYSREIMLFGVSFAMFRESQVPEPGTLVLLGMGLFGMGLARRRRKA